MAWDSAELGPKAYHDIRRGLLGDLDRILEVEEQTTANLTALVLEAAVDIERDFNHAMNVRGHWHHYAPKQRGRGPTGDAVPWLEVAEYTAVSHLLAHLSDDPAVTFPGLPMGGDLRYATDGALVHADIKATGPNDLVDEVVVPPYQVSGNGELTDDDGVKNEILIFEGRTSSRRVDEFYPALPPFYLYPDAVKLCLTFFLKVVYTVEDYGIQPLKAFELACLPNGLLLFHGPEYAFIHGLFVPGKDDRKKDPEDRRVRVRFPELAEIAPWRVTHIARSDSGEWAAAPWST